MTQLNVGFLVYPGAIQLDVMGAYQVLSFLPNACIDLIGKTVEPIVSNEGLTIKPTTSLADCPQLNVICVPGGGVGQLSVMADCDMLGFLQGQSVAADYVTSVCTGSMILAAAGLLQGYQAACHWAFRDQLEVLGVEVVERRVAIDRNRITGAGVTSGIDLGLTVLGLLAGEDVAKMAQLIMEYSPEPPFNAGSPATAGDDIVRRFKANSKPLIDAFWKQTRYCQATAAGCPRRGATR